MSRRTFPLAALVIVPATALGYALAGVAGVALTSALLAASFVMATRSGDRILLRWLGAEPAPATLPAAWTRGRLVRLSKAAGIDAPDLRVTDADQINVFAVAAGKEPAVCVTRGFLESLSRPEREALLALQVERLRNGVARDSSRGALVAGAISWLGSLGLWRRAETDANPLALPTATVTAPLAAAVSRTASSSTRERAAHQRAGLPRHRWSTLVAALERAELSAHAAPLAVPAALGATAVVHPHLGVPDSSLSRLFGRGVPVAERKEWVGRPTPLQPVASRRRRPRLPDAA